MKIFKYIAIALMGAVTVFGLSLTPAVSQEKAKVAKVAQIKKMTPDEIPQYLQDLSVTIHAGRSQGSGVIKTRDGVNYILTAGHVVEGLRHTRSIIDPKTGGSRTKIEFEDAKIVKEIYDDDGRSVGRVIMDAEVLRYSDADNGEDLALLRLRKKNFVKSSVNFDSKGIVPVGTDLLHVGSLLGQLGSNSLTTGVVSQQGRVLRGVVYDQSTCAAFPGSSGGGIYRKADGAYVGMIVRGAGETFNLYVPMRRMRTWAERQGIQFVFDDAVAVPTEKVLRSSPIEDVAGEDRKDQKSNPSPHNNVNEPNIQFRLYVRPTNPTPSSIPQVKLGRFQASW
jgi:S1-C subfamily serine protease